MPIDRWGAPDRLLAPGFVHGGRRLRWMAAAVLLVALPGAPAGAEGDPPAEPQGWHVVRPGENLHILAARYLGDEARWPELWRWNPGVRDPDVLQPGARLRVAHQEATAEPAARVEVVARTVEAKPEPEAWFAAAPGVFLLERDGVRTREDASAELAFSDGDRLRLGENSLVFLQLERGRLRGQKPPAAAGAAAATVTAQAAARPLRRAVEVVQGRADVDLSPRAGARRAAVELHVAGAAASVRPSAAGTGSSRARRDADGARLMVYDGAARITAAGSTVEVPAGSGTSVLAGAAPTPPETLLAAPRPVEPEEGATVGFEGVSFAWAPPRDQPPGVVYELEICRDPRCAAVAVRAASIAGPRYLAPRLEPGRYWWRLTPRSASGLDGFASPPRALEVSASNDRLAPTVRLEIAGRSVDRGARRIWSSDATVRLVAGDEAGGSGLAQATLEVDGRPVPDGSFAPPFASGTYRLSARATDRAGNVGVAAPTDFEVDASAPEIGWEKLGPGAASGLALEPWGGRQSALEWKAVDPLWLAWRWSEPSRSLDALPLRFAGANPRSEVLLVAERRVEFSEPVAIVLEAGEALRVRFSDAGADLVAAAIRRDAPAGMPGRAGATDALVFEARDGFGRSARVRVVLLER